MTETTERAGAKTEILTDAEGTPVSMRVTFAFEDKEDPFTEFVPREILNQRTEVWTDDPPTGSVRVKFTFEGKEYRLSEPPPREIPNLREEVGRWEKEYL